MNNFCLFDAVGRKRIIIQCISGFDKFYGVEIGEK
jgi:hypothetical protein